MGERNNGSPLPDSVRPDSWHESGGAGHEAKEILSIVPLSTHNRVQTLYAGREATFPVLPLAALEVNGRSTP